MNQTEFARQLGLTQTGVSYMERPGSTVTEQTIRTVCLAFGVREQWLRTGEEPVFDRQKKEEPLDELIRSKAVSPLEVEILKAYFALDPDMRKELLRHFQTYLSRTPEEGPDAPPEGKKYI